MKLQYLCYLLIAFTFSLFLSQPSLKAAEDLRLREGISYVHDLDKGFPIIANKLEDVKIEPGKAHFIFFGAAGDLNTNRQSKRVVDLYKKFRDQAVKFIIIDVDHVNSIEAKHIIRNYYQGYIPQEVILDKESKTFWTHSGESDTSVLINELSKVLP